MNPDNAVALEAKFKHPRVSILAQGNYLLCLMTKLRNIETTNKAFVEITERIGDLLIYTGKLTT